MTETQEFKLRVGESTLTFVVGGIAMQAGGAVRVVQDENIVLVTATMASAPRPGMDFFPLLVDYEERMYAVGRIPGSFIRRETRPPESAILTCRLIDRPLRPLFPKGMRNDVQVVAMALSSDQEVQPDILAMNGASAALAISQIPFEGPIGGVRIGRINGKWIINPTYAQTEESEIDLVVAGTADAILMVEAGMSVVSEDLVLEALALAHKEIQKIVAFINEMAKAVGKPKVEPVLSLPDEALVKFVKSLVEADVAEAVTIIDADQRKAAMQEALAKAHAALQETSDELLQQIYLAKVGDVATIIGDIEKKAMRRMVLEEGRRMDGRSLTQVRPISVEVGLLPRAHGSALFTRGNTQALSVATLGGIGDSQPLDTISPETERRYMHHYNFPGYSTGEVRPNRGQSRREVGHGFLARRALLPVLPDLEEFPYAIRVVSDMMGSNGSTSMASTCGSTLSLMDAGVPIKAMVGGVAMGLIQEGDKVAILTDILGSEDHLGDMDFKVTGTEKGITALQMDMKVSGLDMNLMRQALEQARQGRLHIIGEMKKVIDKPRAELSKYAPRVITLQINPDDIGALIGPGGKTVKKIVEETGVKIDIQDDGRVFIITPDAAAAKAARAQVERLTRRAEVGEVYEGKVTRTTSFGAFVEIFPGKEGMVHISQLAPKRVERVEDIVKVGDQVRVKVMEIDAQGRVNLTRKGLEEAAAGDGGAAKH